MHAYCFIAWRFTSYNSVCPPGADRIQNTFFLLLLPVFVFTQLLPSNALIRYVTIHCISHIVHLLTAKTFLVRDWHYMPVNIFLEALFSIKTTIILCCCTHVMGCLRHFIKLLLLFICMDVTLPLFLSLSLSFLLLPLWSTGHPWNALFHFSFLILRQPTGLLVQWISPVANPLRYRTTQTE
jgi:hypothetical protein